MKRTPHELDPEAGYAALCGGSAMVSGPRRERLVVTGDDRVRFINGLVTCDVGALAPNCGALGFFTGQNGRVLADVVVWATEGSFELDVPLGRAQLIGAHLQKYRVADRVEIEIAEEQPGILLAGVAAARYLAELVGAEPPSRIWTYRKITGLDVFLEGWIGTPLFRMRGESGVVADLTARLEAVVAGIATEEAIDAVRIERGRPWFGVDFGDDSLPQETGLEQEAVSFTKGCYLGQEIVARVHYRGKAPRELRGVKLEGRGRLQVGMDVLVDGQAVGIVSTAAYSPRFGSDIALAKLHRSVEPGTVAALANGASVSIVALPFVPSDEHEPTL